MGIGGVDVLGGLLPAEVLGAEGKSGESMVLVGERGGPAGTGLPVGVGSWMGAGSGRRKMEAR